MSVTSSSKNRSGIRHGIDFYICMPNQYWNPVRGRTGCPNGRYWLTKGHKVNVACIPHSCYLSIQGSIPCMSLPVNCNYGKRIFIITLWILRRFQWLKRSFLLRIHEKWQVRFLHAECGALFWDSTHYHYALALESVLLTYKGQKTNSATDWKQSGRAMPIATGIAQRNIFFIFSSFLST